MIPTNELRINNWVLADSEPYQIGCGWEIDKRGDYDPIPLSADILEKARFLCLNYETRKEYSIGEIRISSYPSGEFTFMWNGQVVYIKSVHQLQNLYFALTGEELDYNP